MAQRQHWPPWIRGRVRFAESITALFESRARQAGKQRRRFTIAEIAPDRGAGAVHGRLGVTGIALVEEHGIDMARLVQPAWRWLVKYHSSNAQGQRARIL